jgi:hypothetical protein
MKRTQVLVLSALALLPALPLLAQSSSNPFEGMTRFTGTVQAFAAHTLTVTTENGGTTTLELPESLAITKSVPATIGDLGAGKFVGCTAVQGGDGRLRATECHIFPESMRGRGEGHNPMGPPKTTMTNGNIATMTNGNVDGAKGDGTGAVLHVSYKGGAQDILVTDKTQITQVAVGNASLLKPGVRVNGAARKEPGGAARVQFLNIVP